MALGLGLASSGGGSVATAEDCAPLIRQMEEQLAAAERLADQGQTQKAESVAIQGLVLVERAASVCPNDRHVHGVGVLLCVQARDLERASAHLARFEQLTPYGERDPQLHYLRGHVQLSLLGRPDLALRSVERMQAVAPEYYQRPRETLYFRALLDRAVALSREKQHVDALRHLEAALALARRRGRTGWEQLVLARMATTLERDFRHAQALDIWRKLRAADPTNPAWPYQEALALAVVLRPKEAIVAYRQSLELLPSFRGPPELIAELGRARLRLGNCLRLVAGVTADVAERAKLLAESRQELERFHAEQPKVALGPFWIGVLHYEEGDDPSKALPWFEKAFALDPDCQATLDYLLRAHARMGGPPTEGGRPPTPEERAAWEAKGAAWKLDSETNRERREEVRRARERETGDEYGGCL